jgi:hypothetical protein
MEMLKPSQRKFYGRNTARLIERLGHIGKVLVTPRRLDEFTQEHYVETKAWVENVEQFTEQLFGDIEKALWKTKGGKVAVNVVPIVRSEVLALRITRAKRYLGREKSKLLTRWLEMDSTLLGATKNEIDLYGTVHWMKQESVGNIRAYLSGLREFYAKRAS